MDIVNHLPRFVVLWGFGDLWKCVCLKKTKSYKGEPDKWIIGLWYAINCCSRSWFIYCSAGEREGNCIYLVIKLRTSADLQCLIFASVCVISGTVLLFLLVYLLLIRYTSSKIESL